MVYDFYAVCICVCVLPSLSGSRVMATLSLPLPRLTRWGEAVWTFRPFPVSIRSRDGDYEHQAEGKGHFQTKVFIIVSVCVCVCSLTLCSTGDIWSDSGWNIISQSWRREKGESALRLKHIIIHSHKSLMFCSHHFFILKCTWGFFSISISLLKSNHLQHIRPHCADNCVNVQSFIHSCKLT